MKYLLFFLGFINQSAIASDLIVTARDNTFSETSQFKKILLAENTTVTINTGTVTGCKTKKQISTKLKISSQLNKTGKYTIKYVWSDIIKKNDCYMEPANIQTFSAAIDWDPQETPEQEILRVNNIIFTISEKI